MKNAIYDWRNINESNILYAFSTCSHNYCDAIALHCTVLYCTAKYTHRKRSNISDIQAFKILKFCLDFTRFLENLRRFQMIYGILGKRRRKTSALFTNTTFENVMQSIFYMNQPTKSGSWTNLFVRLKDTNTSWLFISLKINQSDNIFQNTFNRKYPNTHTKIQETLKSRNESRLRDIC